MKPLTDSQKMALCLVATRGEEPTYSSNSTGDGCIHSSSAMALETRGLIEVRYGPKDRLMTSPRWFITAAGWEAVEGIADRDGGDCIHDAHLGLNTYDCARCTARRALSTNHEHHWSEWEEARHGWRRHCACSAYQSTFKDPTSGAA